MRHSTKDSLAITLIAGVVGMCLHPAHALSAGPAVQPSSVQESDTSPPAGANSKTDSTAELNEVTVIGIR